MVAKSTFVGRALNFRVCMSLKGAVLRSPHLFRQPPHFEIPTCIVLYNMTLFMITATKTSYVPLYIHTYIHFIEHIPTLSLLKILSAFWMLVKEQSCLELQLQYICEDVTQFRPVMRFDSTPLYSRYCQILLSASPFGFG